MLARSLTALLLFGAVSTVFADVYLSPDGSGKKDGSGKEDALPAGSLQKAWDQMLAGETLWLLSGTYPEAKLNLQSGGASGKRKVLRGLDTGAGLPLWTSGFNRANPAKTGGRAVNVGGGAQHWEIRDLQLKGYNTAISIAQGAGSFLVSDVTISEVREGIRATGISHAVFSRCQITHYTKRGMRFIELGSGLRVEQSIADAGGKDWATELFHMGFSIESAVPEAVGKNAPVFHDCTAQNNYHDAGKEYWNADGFCVEGKVPEVRFTHCKAFDNTDGGWDVKAQVAVFEGCIAMRNKRNFRIWGNGQFDRCLSAYSIHPGGRGGSCGAWTSGKVVFQRSTFYADSAALSPEDGGKAELEKCIIVAAPGRSVWNEKFASSIAVKDSVIFTEKDGEDPQLLDPQKDWQGQGNNFDSRRHGQAKGFFALPASDASAAGKSPAKAPDSHLPVKAGG